MSALDDAYTALLATVTALKNVKLTRTGNETIAVNLIKTLAAQTPALGQAILGEEQGEPVPPPPPPPPPPATTDPLAKVRNLAQYPQFLASWPNWFAANGPVVGNRSVGSHYMLSITPTDSSRSVQGCLDSILQALSYGQDWFAMDIIGGQWGSGGSTWASNMFAAAEQIAAAGGPMFYLFWSADGQSNADIDAEMIAFMGRPNYFKIGGRPVLSTFALDDTDANWAMILSAVPTALFIPGFLNVLPAQVAGHSFAGLFSGWASGGAANQAAFADKSPVAPHMAATTKAYQDALAAAHKIHIAGVFNQYQNVSLGYSEYEAAVGTAQQWAGIIADPPNAVEIITWNDYNESEMDPVTPDIGGWPQSGSVVPGPWKSGVGFAALDAYFLTQYKTGVLPAILKDTILYFYRASMNSDAVVGPLENKLYAAVAATAPATLNGISVPAGMTALDLGTLKAGPAPVLTLIRNGATVLSVTGPDAVTGPVAGGNMWWTTGVAVAA